MSAAGKGGIKLAYRKTEGVKAHLKAQRAAILAAAVAVLSRHGKDQFTTTRVCEAAGISNGSLYKYFADADELWAAVIGDRLARDVALMRDAGSGDIYPINVLACVLGAFYGCLDRPRLARALVDAPAYRKGIKRELEAYIAATGSPPRARVIQAAAIFGALHCLAEVGAPATSAVELCLNLIGVPAAGSRGVSLAGASAVK